MDEVAGVETAPDHRPSFAHASERRFAALLDFYCIAWQYEPRTFPLAWNRAGEVIEAFTPDFYLPAYDLFIEITTQRQRLVTKKNRKVRRLAEMYPAVRCKVLYQRDYLHLCAKYGLEDVEFDPDTALVDGGGPGLLAS
jgi:hypothetical protein